MDTVVDDGNDDERYGISASNEAPRTVGEAVPYVELLERVLLTNGGC